MAARRSVALFMALALALGLAAAAPAAPAGRRALMAQGACLCCEAAALGCPPQ